MSNTKGSSREIGSHYSAGPWLWLWDSSLRSLAAVAALVAPSVLGGFESLSDTRICRIDPRFAVPCLVYGWRRAVANCLASRLEVHCRVVSTGDFVLESRRGARELLNGKNCAIALAEAAFLGRGTRFVCSSSFGL